MGEKRPLGEYWNTWSSDSAAFYKEGVGPAETGWGSHESNDWNEGDFVRGGADEWNFRVWRAPGLCMEAETVLPMAGRVRGMVVRHDESFTIARALSDEATGYSPSVYYVYRPSDAAMESV
jgi:homospermidine synthase